MATIEFKLPDIGEGVAEGEVTKWLVAAGDAVKEDQPIVEVMTDKATVEIGSPADGRIVELRAKEGETVPVGQVLVVLEAGQGAAPQRPVPQRPAAHAPARAPAAAPPPPPPPAAKSGRPAAAPAPAPAPAGKAKPPSAPPRPVPSAHASAPAATGDDGEREEINFALPDIGEGVAEGEITKWLVRVGDEVKEDQPMLEVMTDKATVEIGSPVDGEVLQLLHPEGSVVPVGGILLVLGSGTPGAAGKAAAPAVRLSAAPAAVAAPALPAAGSSARPAARGATVTLPPPVGATNGGAGRVRAAPAVRRLARELGLDLSRLAGSGPEGRVTMADVRAAKGAPAALPPGPKILGVGGPAPVASRAPAVPAPAPRAPAPALPAAAAESAAPAPQRLQGDERVPLRGLRKRIAAQMRLSKQTAAHFAYVEELDVTALVALRKKGKEAAARKGVHLTYMPFIARATCMALRDFPLLNASLDEAAQEIVLHQRIHLGVAVDTEQGLIVPVIRDADRKSLLEVGRELSELAERARAGKARPEDFGGGTFTITNAGNIGGLLATPIINVPEVAILGVHAIRRRPWVVDEQIVIRDILYLSLSLDHRVVDGAVGARFMNRVKELLESPALMLLES